MMTRGSNQLATILATDMGVDSAYRHSAKRVTPREPLASAGAIFKWYTLYPEDSPVPEARQRLAQRVLTRWALEACGLDFVVLHCCNNNFYFVLLCSWRNNNELWETVFYKDGDTMADFLPFPREGSHKPTFCVWELAPIWHEQQVWARFLASQRDVAAAEEWLRDRYCGAA
jgi:hypothetical protein